MRPFYYLDSGYFAVRQNSGMTMLRFKRIIIATSFRGVDERTRTRNPGDRQKNHRMADFFISPLYLLTILARVGYLIFLRVFSRGDLKGL